MRKRATLILIFLAVLASTAAECRGEMKQLAQACSLAVAQTCDKNYRQCLIACSYYDEGMSQDECAYLCCEDRRSCLIGAECSAPTCGGD